MELQILLFVMSTFLWSARGQLINQIDVVVAQDGSGNYTNIVDAVFNAPNMSSQLYTIKIKEGIYYENVIVDKTKTKVAFIGDGMEKTVITGNRTKNLELIEAPQLVRCYLFIYFCFWILFFLFHLICLNT